MKNKIKFYNILVILCTIITVTILIYIYRLQDYIYPYNEVITEVKEDKYIDNNIGLNEDSESETEKIKEKEINEKSLENSEEDKNEKEVIKKRSLDEHKTDEDEGMIKERTKKKIIKDEKAISVFKVDRNTIVENISIPHKAKLMYIASKLSIDDYKKLYDILHYSNPEKAVKDSYILLKDKLSEKDFEKVKDILSDYINIEVVEKQV